MSTGDEQRERDVRDGLDLNPSDAIWPEDARALLRLLDAERAKVERIDLLRMVWDGDTTTFTGDEIANALHMALTLTHRNGEPLIPQPGT